MLSSEHVSVSRRFYRSLNSLSTARRAMLQFNYSSVQTFNSAQIQKNRMAEIRYFNNFHSLNTVYYCPMLYGFAAST